MCKNMTVLGRLRVRRLRTLSIVVQGTPRDSAQHMHVVWQLKQGQLLQVSMQIDVETAARPGVTKDWQVSAHVQQEEEPCPLE